MGIAFPRARLARAAACSLVCVLFQRREGGDRCGGREIPAEGLTGQCALLPCRRVSLLPGCVCVCLLEQRAALRPCLARERLQIKLPVGFD